MPHNKNFNIRDENDFRKIADLILKNYILFLVSITVALLAAFFANRFSKPTFSISSSILIKATNNQPSGNRNENDFLFSNLFGNNQNFQNELWIMKSYPILEKTADNLDLSVSYYFKGKFNFYEAYKNSPFIVSYLQSHPQPLNSIFTVTFHNDSTFKLVADAKHVMFYDFEKSLVSHEKRKWEFEFEGKVGELIETPDLAFIIEVKDTVKSIDCSVQYGFKIDRISSISSEIQKNTSIVVADRQATVIKLDLVSESQSKGVDILNELMNVYSDQNLDRKNHLATITIDYIEKQLGEISDSLAIAENDLERFRASRQLLDFSNQAEGISALYLDLQNQYDELVSQQRYYDYVLEQLKSDNFANLMLPAAIGISDQVLNELMGELISAESQRSNLIANNQERNPLVQKLGIQIENLKKTIIENISAISSTTEISVEEINKRLKRTKAEINRLPATQRQLGTIERKFRLNDAIYNYLMEKHAESKITKASNLPDDIIIEPAKYMGPVSPNKKMNYMIAVVLGLGLPFGFIWMKNALNNKIESQDDIERLTDKPVLGKIMHNVYRTTNVMLEFPNSPIAESIRALRTNLDFYVRSGQKKVILVTSCFENEGKSFAALNLAVSYAQLGRKTILVDFDLRKPKTYFNEEGTVEGISAYFIDKVGLNDIILKSPHDNLDYILAGVLPPNPVELLALEKTENFLSKLKHDYEIVVLDTTPLAQVTDAYLLMNHSDLKIIIARYGRTIKNVFSLVLRDLAQKKISNICIVLNDNKVYRDQYGYGYGYYNKQGFFKKHIKKLKKRVELSKTKQNIKN